MNTRLIKETRDLLPIIVGSVLLIALPYLLLHIGDAGLGYAALALGCAVMGGSSFGNEFQHRTISLLLSQPIARSVLWRDKMLVLGAGMLASLVMLVLCLHTRPPFAGTEMPLALVFIPLCAFCGAPYWTLLLRHGIGGMAFAVAIPSLLLGMNALLTERLFDEHTIAQVSILILIIYCPLVYWLGYAKFKGLQAVDGTSRDLALPAGLEAFFVRPLTRISARFQSPFAALLKKEFRLQQISFLLAGLFVLVAGVGACLIPHHHDVGEGILAADCFIFVVMLPLIAGATSVAEEKGWGITEWHLTLPPSALKQWSAKMLAALSTSLVLGLLLPIALFLAGDALFGQHSARHSFPSAFDIMCWPLGSLLMTSVAVYAASISKTTLWAILGAVGIFVAAYTSCFLVGAGAVKVVHSLKLWIYYPGPSTELTPLLIAGGLFFMLCLVQWLAWSNFRRCGLTARKAILQLLAILLCVALATLVIMAILFFPRSGHLIQ
jgi:hypothetical protein